MFQTQFCQSKLPVLVQCREHWCCSITILCFYIFIAKNEFGKSFVYFVLHLQNIFYWTLNTFYSFPLFLTLEWHLIYAFLQEWTKEMCFPASWNDIEIVQTFSFSSCRKLLSLLLQCYLNCDTGQNWHFAMILHKLDSLVHLCNIWYNMLDTRFGNFSNCWILVM